jgi:hypothetical protein
MEQGDSLSNDETFRLLAHDIKNQLSNITLVVSQLRCDIPSASPECEDYLDMIILSARKIDELLNQVG